MFVMNECYKRLVVQNVRLEWRLQLPCLNLVNLGGGREMKTCLQGSCRLCDIKNGWQGF